MAGEFTKRQLFGGAIEVEIPEIFIDASQFRPVPDSQEVFVPNSGDTNISIVIDILQRLDLPDVDACQVHFDDVIDGRDALGRLFQVEGPIREFTHFGSTPVWLVQGTIASSYHPAPPPTDPNYFEAQKSLQYTFLLMAIIRLQEQKTDLLITVNCPITKPEDIMNEKRVWHPAYSQPPEGVIGAGTTALVDDTITLLKRGGATLEVKDWDLFSPED